MSSAVTMPSTATTTEQNTFRDSAAPQHGGSLGAVAWFNYSKSQS
jgi:hypothetical protein